MQGIFVLKPSRNFCKKVEYWREANMIYKISSLGPHMTLFPPFRLQSENLEYIKSCLKEIHLNTKNFIWGVTGNTGVFKRDGRVETVYLEVSTDCSLMPYYHPDFYKCIDSLRGEIWSIQESLAVPGITAPERFTPHITLVNHLSEMSNHSFLPDDLKESFKPHLFSAKFVDFYVKQANSKWYLLHSLRLR